MSRKDPRANSVARKQMRAAAMTASDALIQQGHAPGTLYDTPGLATVGEAVAALYGYRLAREQADVAVWDLAAWAALGGAAIPDIARSLGVSPMTVKARLSVRPIARASGADFIRVQGAGGSVQWQYRPATD